MRSVSNGMEDDMIDKDEKIILNGEQEAALGLMMSGANMFLTGEAGTGKSTLVREFLRRCDRECVVLAPTGIAALNAGGTTIHSQMMLKPGLLNPLALEPLTDGNRCRVLRMAKTVIVDEVSMVRSDLFCAMDARLREIAYGQNKEMPFGGKQIVLVGDFMQLPPVVGGNDERKFINERFGGAFAFETDLWVAAMFRTVFLKTVHRQSGDTLFKKVLNDLRHGKFEAAAKVLNNHCIGEKTFHTPPVCLCTTNREARAINDAARLSVKGETRFFSAQVSGRFLEAEFPAEGNMELIVGARVMVLCNQRNEGVLECVNGDMGTITGFGSEDDPEVCVRLDNGKNVKIVPHTWEKYAYVQEISPKTNALVMRQSVVGTFEQIPLRLAYAITIHKSQGLSLDCVSLRLGRGCFDHGQLYTALSRCRTLDGLKIDRRLVPEDLIIDEAVVRFHAEMEAQRDELQVGYCWYEEAMRYYLRRLKTGDGTALPADMRQAEFDFSSRVYDDPVLMTLLRLHEGGAINKYDAPVVEPLVQSIRAGAGVKDAELATIKRLIAKYGNMV